MLIPVTMKNRNKYTKKEILLRVLHYIQYLQRNIDMAKALLKQQQWQRWICGAGLEPICWPDTPARLHPLQLSEATPLELLF